ncbi:MAG: ABC-F family ATP-binding cassette domain-containing protein [Bacteroidota bacterium]
MNYLSAENLSMSYDDKLLFEGLSFGVDQGQKIALIGVNGCGKSTLLKLLAGVEAPTGGKITVRKGLRIAFLSQTPDLPEYATVQDVVFSADLPEVKLIERYEELLAQGVEAADQQQALQEVMAEIDAANAWHYEVRIKQILGKLDISFLDRNIGELSGGQKKRVAMAQALIGEPDLIIMDEPTNHLDLESIEWLEQFISTSKQSLILVTHDRYFLDSVTDEIFELTDGQLFQYKGDYAYYLQKKAERELQRQVETEKAQSLFKVELEWLRRSPKARGTKSKSRIDAAGALKEKASFRGQNQEVKLQVKGRRIGGKVLEIKNLRKAYGDNIILDSFSYTFNRRDRVGVVGPNGVGKTTFLRLLMGEEAADSGKIRMGETIVPGYYRQDGFHFKDNSRIIEVITEAAESVEMSKSQTLSAAQLLEHFLFPRSRHHNFVENLSGGEKRRLHLLRILMTNPNFLILDEPTNDLDLITLRKLEEFLADFEGCLMVVTHDRFFMDRLIDHLFVFEGAGQVRDYPGSYSQYRTWADQQKQEAPSMVAAKPAAPAKEAAPKNRSRKLSFKEKREYESLEGEIEALEEKKALLSDQINGGSTDYEALTTWTKELEEVTAELEAKSDRWLELAEIAEG